MSSKELTRLEVMQRLKDKRLMQKEAALQLGLSVRQIKRLWHKYKKQGAKGLISQLFASKDFSGKAIDRLRRQRDKLIIDKKISSLLYGEIWLNSPID